MSTPTRTQDDIDYLRTLLTPLDPALPGRPPTRPRPDPVPATRRRSWAVAGLAAAAAVVAIVAVAVPMLLAGAGGHAPATAPAPVARPSYDHVQWRDYEGTRLVDTGDWWWNGVDGRYRLLDETGAVTSDVTLLLASTASEAISPDPTTPTTGTTGTAPATASRGPAMGAAGSTPASADPNGAAGTPAPTSGSELTADDFAGTVPSTPDALEEYLSDRHFNVAQGASSIVFQRHLDSGQMAALVSLARSGAPHPQETTLPTGQSAVVLKLTDPTGGMDASTRLVLDSSGTRILGTTYVVDGQTWWRLVTVSELTATTS